MNPARGPAGQNYHANQANQGNQQYPGYEGYQGQGYPPPSGYPQPGPSYPRPTKQGFNFQDLTQRWQAVLAGRSVATFDEQLPSANWPTIWAGLLIYGVVRGIISAISTAVVPTYRIDDTVYSNGSPVGSFFGGIIGVIISFFIGAGILYLIAKMFNGTGTYLSYAYLLSLFIVPLGIASALVGWIPIFGWLVTLAIAIFEVYLAILATTSAHRLPMDRAAWVVLIPVIVAFVLAVLLLILSAIALAALGFHF